jgi:hypothetical protein
VALTGLSEAGAEVNHLPYMKINLVGVDKLVFMPLFGIALCV